MQADIITLHKVLKFKIANYIHKNEKEPSTPAVAQLLSVTLYSRRFFPYYTFNVLGGVDEQGVGCCFSYDAVGTVERVRYSSSGTGHELVQPLLDNQVSTTDYTWCLLV
jgi:20S proteasome subunit beta 6